MYDWRPIESAPAGDFLLVYFGGGPPEVARWLVDRNYWQDTGGLDFAYGDLVPTHWMPLPEPPK